MPRYQYEWPLIMKQNIRLYTFNISKTLEILRRRSRSIDFSFEFILLLVIIATQMA